MSAILQHTLKVEGKKDSTNQSSLQEIHVYSSTSNQMKLLQLFIWVLQYLRNPPHKYYTKMLLSYFPIKYTTYFNWNNQNSSAMGRWTESLLLLLWPVLQPILLVVLISSLLRLGTLEKPYAEKEKYKKQ